ncbi:hypothetical protein AURDEDRAFT_141920 [Auricularia subglabra TFB-10046 SS5]|nr:hypothetical protein AURDEDRAFT_141920 [Auricularia subglabra TFB-10046 SS5]
MATALLEYQEPAGFDGLAAPELAAGPDAGPDGLASIAAYYSLAFPGQTYYLQRLNVTIGRKLLTRGTSADGPRDVDIDLGPLKSVSRLHAKITYDEDDERWVLDIYGRNGAWVDGAWSGPGCRVPLASRSQIQIASRSFSFILPPTEPPDDSPLTSSPTSTTRPRSPSLDATSLSPASSPGSAASPTPPDPELALEPDIVQRPKPKLIRKRGASSSDGSASPAAAPPPEPKPAAPPAPEPQLPYAPVTAVAPPKPPKAAKPKAGKGPAAPKAKAAPQPALPPAPASVPAEPPAPAPLPPPPRPPPAPRLPGQPEPPKPAATLSQLCYRAITGLGGRATLQGILGWIMDTYDWYRIHEGEKWESSVRHNLSSNAAFVKSRRTSDEPGKGAFWTVDPAHVEAFEVAESRAAKPAAGGSGKTVSKKDGPSKVKKEQPATVPMPVMHQLPPPFAKVAAKGPPPLTTSKPLGSPFTSKPLLTSKPLASPFTSKPLPFKPAAPKGAGPVKQEAVAAAVPPPPPVAVPAAYPPSAVYPPHAMVPAPPMVAAHPPPMAVAPHPLPIAVAPPPIAVAPPFPVAIAAAPVPPSAPPAPVASSSTPGDGVSHVPIIVGPLPASYVLAPGAEPPLIVLHEGTLVLAPKAFSNLTPAEISEFEKLGPQKALEALQGHMVKFLKEQMRLRGRGRGRGRGGPGRGGGGGRGAQARPRSNSAEAADVPPAKRARLDA